MFLYLFLELVMNLGRAFTEQMFTVPDVTSGVQDKNSTLGHDSGLSGVLSSSSNNIISGGFSNLTFIYLHNLKTFKL